MAFDLRMGRSFSTIFGFGNHARRQPQTTRQQHKPARMSKWQVIRRFLLLSMHYRGQKCCFNFYTTAHRCYAALVKTPAVVKWTDRRFQRISKRSDNACGKFHFLNVDHKQPRCTFIQHPCLLVTIPRRCQLQIEP